MTVIDIKFSENLPSRAQNRLRYNMELAAWREKHRKATAANDYAALDQLDREYEMVGLP